MPIPGEEFLLAATALGDDTEVVADKKGRVQRLQTVGKKLEALIENALYGRGQLHLALKTKAGRSEMFNVVSGHRWNCGENNDWRSRGPEPCDVMVVGKTLTTDDAQKCRWFSDESGNELLKTLAKLGVADYRRWYVTGVLKTQHLINGEGAIKPRWIADQAFLLQQEIRLVKPKFILMLGSEAVKVFCGKQATLTGIAGQVIDLEFSMATSEEDDTPPLKVKAMACMHPSAIVHKPDAAPQFTEALRRFSDLVAGGNGCVSEEGLDHRLIEDEAQLLALCEEINQTTTNRIIAMDAEWHGDHPENPGAYLRTVQLSWAEKKAAVIKLNHAGGAPAFKQFVRKDGKVWKKQFTTDGGQARAMKILSKFMEDKRPCGHYFVADLEWLVPAGLDLRKQFAAPATWEEMPEKGGLDTALMAHALDETGDFSLTGQVLTYTTAPRYDAILNQWKSDYCRQQGIEKAALEGYGDCPDEILVPYGAYDADVTYRLCMRHMKALYADEFGNNCWKPYWISQKATLAVLEITRTGLVLDRERVATLTERYMHAKNELERKIKTWACWPNLNLNSPFEVRELLFGRKYNGKEKVKGKRPRLRPKGAKSIATEPLVATGKPVKQWSEVVEAKKEDEATPGTDKMTLGILWHGSDKLKVWRKGEWVVRNLRKPIGWIRDYRFISQVLKSVLRPPMSEDDESGGVSYQHDDDGNLMYDKGLPSWVCGDGRVRTTIYQTKETGRWSSARPPLQNLSARREPDYKRILGDQYVSPLRSVLCAPPGWCLVEADYVGAELFVMAILSGDPVMLDHALRNQLPEDHPNYYDIHSNVAVLAFGFDCPPTKAGLASIDKAHMRIVAKAVIFGRAYGRGPKAIALGAQEEGVFVSVSDAERIVAALDALYPSLSTLFDECRWRAVGPDHWSREKFLAAHPDSNPDVVPRWLCSPFGRYRRFPAIRLAKQRGEFERQSMNFPIQGMVADAISLAVAELYDYRENAWAAGATADDIDYRICLQVHDALMVMAPAKHVPKVLTEILPLCMCERVPLYPTSMDGVPLGTGPYHFGVDTKVVQSWGVSMTPDDCFAIDLDPKYAGWTQYEDGFIKGGDTKKIWIPHRGYIKVA
jgi:uracil-DNA glycosylase family 4